MTNFHDNQHDVPELIFQGKKQYKPEALCDADMLTALERWRAREDLTDPDVELLHLDETRSFSISHTGESANYWPDEKSNLVGESIVREFLFHEGLCNLSDLTVRLYVTTYKVIAILDTEYLLVCPYPTAAGNIGGLVVVCVNSRLKPEMSLTGDSDNE